ncbi:MAG: universal stress protein [Calditrichae bacterium]|nr:universal stress protein [Calditrichota bacterium]MCB9087005.1 universal stress protein [Calditrichia bacterium]
MELPTIGMKHILYATDNSEDARSAFAYAAGIAKQFGAKLTLLHVVQDLKDMVAFDFGIERSVAAQKWFSVNKDYFEEIKKQVQEIAQSTYGGEAVHVDDVVVEKGNPVKTILEIAKEKECDMIVMGVKGRSVLEDTVLGGTVNGVIRRSKIPVLVIRHKTLEQAGGENE